jgi:hypothetical protein
VSGYAWFPPSFEARKLGEIGLAVNSLLENELVSPARIERATY